jgi:hypothetical protein
VEWSRSVVNSVWLFSGTAFCPRGHAPGSATAWMKPIAEESAPNAGSGLEATAAGAAPEEDQVR